MVDTNIVAAKLLGIDIDKKFNFSSCIVKCYRRIVWVCLTILWGWRWKGQQLSLTEWHGKSKTNDESYYGEKILLSLHELIELQTFENQLELDKKLDLLISITQEKELKPDFFL